MLLFYHFSLREYLWKSGLFGNSPFLSVIYLCTADGTAGTWFAVDTLPENTVDHHRDHVIPIAVKAFQRSLQIKKWIVEAQ